MRYCIDLIVPTKNQVEAICHGMKEAVRRNKHEAIRKVVVKVITPWDALNFGSENWQVKVALDINDEIEDVTLIEAQLWALNELHKIQIGIISAQCGRAGVEVNS